MTLSDYLSSQAKKETTGGMINHVNETQVSELAEYKKQAEQENHIQKNTFELKPDNKPPQEDIFDKIVKGDYWFEVQKSNGDIRYTQHSTPENLTEYYTLLNHYYGLPLPLQVIPIQYDIKTCRIEKIIKDDL